jgi:hypothetical protein
LIDKAGWATLTLASTAFSSRMVNDLAPGPSAAVGTNTAACSIGVYASTIMIFARVNPGKPATRWRSNGA